MSRPSTRFSRPRANTVTPDDGRRVFVKTATAAHMASGGPPPWEALPGAGDLAAFVSGAGLQSTSAARSL